MMSQYYSFKLLLSWWIFLFYSENTTLQQQLETAGEDCDLLRKQSLYHIRTS